MNVITPADSADKERAITTFTIDAENDITAYVSSEEAGQRDAAALIHFDSQAILAKVSAEWLMSRFVEIRSSCSAWGWYIGYSLSY